MKKLLKKIGFALSIFGICLIPLIGYGFPVFFESIPMYNACGELVIGLPDRLRMLLSNEAYQILLFTTIIVTAFSFGIDIEEKQQNSFKLEN